MPSVRDNETYGLSATQVLSTGDWGDHTLEYGVQYVESTTGGENRQSSTGFNLSVLRPRVRFWDGVDNDGPGVDPTFNLVSYLRRRLPDRLPLGALPLGGTQASRATAFYVQDTWQFEQWRFDVGLRYDDWSGAGPLPTMDLEFHLPGSRVSA